MQQTSAVEASRELTRSSPQEQPSGPFVDDRWWSRRSPFHGMADGEQLRQCTTAQGLREPRFGVSTLPPPKESFGSPCASGADSASPPAVIGGGSGLQLCPVSARAMHSATAHSGFKTWLTPVDSGCLWWFQVRFQSEPCPRRGIARTTSQNTVKIDCVPQLDHREKDAGRLGGTRLHARSHTVPHKALESIHFQPSQASHQDEFVVDRPCSSSLQQIPRDGGEIHRNEPSSSQTSPPLAWTALSEQSLRTTHCRADDPY